MADVIAAAAPNPPKGGHGRSKSISSRIIEGARDELVQKFLSGEHCTLHPHQRVCLYCPESYSLVCPLCVTTVHQGKNFEELTEAVDRIYSAMEVKLDHMMENNDKVKDLCESLRKLKIQRRLRNAITDFFAGKIQTEIHFNSVTKQDQIRRGIETLRNLADEREAALIEEIQNVETEKLAKLKKQLENTWAEQQQLKRLGEDATSALGSTKPTSLLHQINLLDRWCAKEADEIEDEMDDTTQNFVEEDPCVNSDIGKTLPVYKHGLPLKPSELAMLDFEKRTDGTEDGDSEAQAADHARNSSISEEDQLHEEEMAQMKAEVEKMREELAATNLRLGTLEEEKSKKEAELDSLRNI